MHGWLRFGEGIPLLCQLALNQPSTFTIPYLDPGSLRRTSSIARVASKVGFTQASKTSDLLSEMGLVSTVSTTLASNLSTNRPSMSWKMQYRPGSKWNPKSAFRVRPR
jgi:hypothetical protein